MPGHTGDLCRQSASSEVDEGDDITEGSGGGAVLQEGGDSDGAGAGHGDLEAAGISVKTVESCRPEIQHFSIRTKCNVFLTRENPMGSELVNWRQGVGTWIKVSAY